MNTQSMVPRVLWLSIICSILTTINFATALGSVEPPVSSDEFSFILTSYPGNNFQDYAEHTSQNLHIKASEKHIAFLFGIISDIERNQEGDFRFLPIKMLNIGYTPEEGFYAQILDDTQGGYPCCSFIDPDDFHGVLTEGFICGFWILEFE
jgi:hypothetical protein